MVRMRLLDEAAQEIKAMDPNTAVTKNFIRDLAIENKVKTVMCGKKRLINFDDLLEYLANPSQEQPESCPGIRAILEKLRV